MKKFKEFLFFVVPFVLLLVISFLSIFLSFKNNVPTFIGSANYFKLFLADGLAIKAIFNFLFLPAASAIVLPNIIIKLIKNKLKMQRNTCFIVLFLVGTIVAFGYYIYIKTSGSFIPAELLVPSALSQISKSITLSDFLFSLQSGILSAFLFWVIEGLTSIIKTLLNKLKKSKA